jgi:hypothetical protein
MQCDVISLGFLPIDEVFLEDLYNKISFENKNNDVVTFQTFLTFTRTIDTPLARKVFKTTDYSTTQEFELNKFSFGLWNFCTMDENDLMLFMFKIYVNQEDGVYQKKLSEETMNQMLIDIHGCQSSTVLT